MKFNPYKEVGGRNVLFMLKGDGVQIFHPLKGGYERCQPVLTWRRGGGAQTISDTRFFNFVMVTFGCQVFRLADALFRTLPWRCLNTC